MSTQWSEWKDEFIRENYGKMPMKDIATRLGITARTVANRARRLGIKAMSYPEMLENEEFRKAVNKRISDGQKVSTRIYRHFAEHPEVGKETRFQKGHTITESTKRKVAAAYRKAVYDELVRMKYGMPRKTKIRLKRKNYIDRKKYFPDEVAMEETKTK